MSSPRGGAEDAAWLAGLPRAAREALPEQVWAYVAQGARDGVTTAESTDAWRTHRLHPQVLRDVTNVDLATDLLGHDAAVPWGVAPVTLPRAVHPEGELAIARATAEVGSLMVVSSNAGTTFAEIGGTGVRWWLQAYLPADRTLALPLLAAAVAAGATAVVLTVDTPVVGTKYDAAREEVERLHPGLTGVNTIAAGLDPAAAGAEKALDLGPHDLAWLADVTGLPVVVKGVLRADDALRCVQAGAAGVWVSNHGGRQLDRSASTAAVLPEVSASVAGTVPVYVDGGLRSGLDVVTALALGADAVFLGRPVLYALLDGAPGVARLHAEMARQVAESLRLGGCSSVPDARVLVRTAGGGTG